jgi:hypothetical protein
VYELAFEGGDVCAGERRAECGSGRHAPRTSGLADVEPAENAVVA